MQPADRQEAPQETGRKPEILVGPVARPSAPRQRDPTQVSDSASWLIDGAPRLAAAIAALPALIWPLAWLVASLLLASFASRRGQRAGVADAVVSPLRGLGRAVRPSSLIGAVLGLVFALLLGALIGAAWGLVQWLPSEGTDGLLAAVRLAALHYLLPFGSAIACFWLLRRAFEQPGTGEAIRGRARRLGEGRLTVAAGIATVFAVVCLLLSGPSFFPFGSGARGRRPPRSARGRRARRRGEPRRGPGGRRRRLPRR